MSTLGKPNGVLTFTTNGKAHTDIEEELWRKLQAAYNRGLKDGKKA